jgi:hypothetical protein
MCQFLEDSLGCGSAHEYGAKQVRLTKWQIFLRIFALKEHHKYNGMKIRKGERI